MEGDPSLKIRLLENELAEALEASSTYKEQIKRWVENSGHLINTSIIACWGKQKTRI